MTKLCVLVAVLAGCSKSADCDGAGAAVEAKATAAVAGIEDDKVRETRLKLAPLAGKLIATTCKRDGWSAETTDCVKAVEDNVYKRCELTMTDVQIQKMKDGENQIRQDIQSELDKLK